MMSISVYLCKLVKNTQINLDYVCYAADLHTVLIYGAHNVTLWLRTGVTGLSRERSWVTSGNINSRYENYTAGNSGLTLVFSTFVLALEGPGSNSELGSSYVFTQSPHLTGFLQNFHPLSSACSHLVCARTESCSHCNPH